MYQHLTDEQLLHMLQKDGRTAFEEIYRRYCEQMSLYVLKVIHSTEDARDIVQDVFVSIWKRNDELRICQSLKSYLLKSVINLSLRYIERHHRIQDFLKSLAAYCSGLDVSTTGKLEFQELVSKLHGVVAMLPAKMQEVYVLSRDENLSHKEIARRLGIAETTVKKQVTNALKVIRTNDQSTVYFGLKQKNDYLPCGVDVCT